MKKNNFLILIPVLIFLTPLFFFSCGQGKSARNANDTQEKQKRAVQEKGFPFPQSRLVANLEWDKGPHPYDESAFRLKFSPSPGEENSSPLDLVSSPEAVEIELWMPDMNHGSSPVTLTEIAKGEFAVSEVYFTMTGYWDLIIRLKKDGKILEEKKLGYHL